jgi:hypothetical protein
VELADKLTGFGVSSCSRDTLKGLQIFDGSCCLEMPAFWKKSVPHTTIQFKCKAFQIKRGAHKYLFSGDHPTTQTHTKLEAVKKTKTKLHGLSLRANYTDRAAAASRQS